MYPLDTMGHKCSAWWRKPQNGTLGDTEDENLVEATVDKDAIVAENKGHPCRIFRAELPRPRVGEQAARSRGARAQRLNHQSIFSLFSLIIS